MRTIIALVRGLLLAVAMPSGLAASPPAAQPAFVSDQILVKPAAAAGEAALHAAFAAQGARETGRIPELGVRLLRVPAERVDRVVAALSRNPNIEFAEKDPIAQALLTPNDPSFGSQWHLPKINAPLAWDLGTGDAGIVIAVLDTGIAYGHPDLKGKVLQGYNFISNNTNAADDHGHGTLVAGAAAALSNNGAGVAGVAWRNTILPVKVLDAAGSGSHSAIANGLIYAADQGARIINLSLGSTSSSSTLQQAVDYAWSRNAVIVAAAGNNGNSTVVYPAGYKNAIGVSGLASNDTLASWSSYGTHVSIAAPGANILTTTMSGSYGQASGTSLAAPLVSGVAALATSAKPQLTNVELRALIEQNATDLGTAGFDSQFGFGRVDARKAMEAAAAAKVADTTAPAVKISSPVGGSTVKGNTEVWVDATDDIGVVRMDLYINNGFLASTTASSAAFVWNTAGFADGSHVLQARAVDAAGNTGVSSQVTVKVANGSADTAAPVVTIASPADGATVTKSVKIDVRSSDNVGVQRIELYIDGRLHGTSTAANAVFSWNASRVAKGEHRIQAYAFDAAGNIGTRAIRVYKK